ncbi:MAG: adenylate kinase, partial [Proteobacteria bacterium]
PSAILMDRLTGRRVCKNCATVYHIVRKAPNVEGVCDVCGHAVVQRNDDKPEVIGARLKNYEEYTSPLKDYYTKAHKYVELDGNRETDAVYSDLKKVIS